MHGFGSHTFSLINSKNERNWVKFHFKSMQGIENLTNDEAAKLVGQDREYSQADLYRHIEKGKFPQWKMCIQIMSEEQARNFRFNPFDLTKVWPHKEFPLIEVGILELNRNPDNYFSQVEQAAFNPANIVPGIGFSPDRMLQGRLFAYADAARYRLGANFESLPVNQPKCPVHHQMRDGLMALGDNGGSAVNYEPNSFDDSSDNRSLLEPPLALDGAADSYNHKQNEQDNFTQPGDLYRLLSAEEQDRLTSNVMVSMTGVPVEIQRRATQNFYKADKACGEAIARKLGITL